MGVNVWRHMHSTYSTFSVHSIVQTVYPNQMIFFFLFRMNFIGVMFYLKHHFRSSKDFVCVCLQECLHSMESVSGECSESDPVSDEWLWKLQEPGFRADQDFPGAQRAAAKKGTQLTDILRMMKATVIKSLAVIIQDTLERNVILWPYMV